MRRVYVIGAVVVGFAAGAVLGAAFVGDTDAQAQTASGGDVGLDAIQRVVIEMDYHHLGDRHEPRYQNPYPEGTVWSATFVLDERRGTTAYVSLVIADAQDGADLVINGHRVALPYGCHRGDVTTRNALLTVPASAFRVGSNDISLESVWIDDYGEHDDFEFGELVVYFN